MKTIHFPLKEVYSKFLKETEGITSTEWKCPIWAKIKDDKLVLNLGSPISFGTTFENRDGEKHPEWVGCVRCWRFTGTAENYIDYGLNSPAEFNREIGIKFEIDKFVNSFNFSYLEEEIRTYCKSKGYDVEFI